MSSLIRDYTNYMFLLEMAKFQNLPSCILEIYCSKYGDRIYGGSKEEHALSREFFTWIHFNTWT